MPEILFCRPCQEAGHTCIAGGAIEDFPDGVPKCAFCEDGKPCPKTNQRSYSIERFDEKDELEDTVAAAIRKSKPEPTPQVEVRYCSECRNKLRANNLHDRCANCRSTDPVERARMNREARDKRLARAEQSNEVITTDDPTTPDLTAEETNAMSEKILCACGCGKAAMKKRFYARGHKPKDAAASSAKKPKKAKVEKSTPPRKTSATPVGAAPLASRNENGNGHFATLKVSESQLNSLFLGLTLEERAACVQSWLER